MTVRVNNIDQLADMVTRLYAADPDRAEGRIESYLSDALADLPSPERDEVLGTLAAALAPAPIDASEGISVDHDVLLRLFSFLLGKKVTSADFTSDELIERLAQSLNTIFDSLNRLVAVINWTFMGETQGVETIRQVIGFHLDGAEQVKSLENYLNQINTAFLAAQRASRVAAEKLVREILKELDPEAMRTASGGGLKIGRKRRANAFEVYSEKYANLSRWLEDGRFMDEFLREFERNCQQQFNLNEEEH
jgi:hypothetical protein